MGTGLTKVAYVWTFIQCIKKLLTAAIIVLLYSYPTAQISIILTINILAALFIIIFNPYHNFVYRILALINEVTSVTFMAVLLAYQCTPEGTTRNNLGEIVQAHLLMQIGIQLLFITYFFINVLAVIKNWVGRYLAGESPVG